MIGMGSRWPVGAPSPRARPAFTLIELLVVMVLMGILAGIAVPRFSSAQTAQRLAATGRRIEADLEFAKRRARLTGTSVTVRFDPGLNQYTLVGIPDPVHTNPDIEVDLSSAPYEVDLVQADFDGDADLVLNAYGLPDSGGTIILNVGKLQDTLTFSDGTSGTIQFIRIRTILEVN